MWDANPSPLRENFDCMVLCWPGWSRWNCVSASPLCLKTCNFRWAKVYLLSCDTWNSLFKNIFSFTYLAVLGLSCGTRHLSVKFTHSLLVAWGLSCSAACGILVPWPGIKPTSLALQGGVLTTGPPGKSSHMKFFVTLPASCRVPWLQVPYLPLEPYKPWKQCTGETSQNGRHSWTKSPKKGLEPEHLQYSRE